MTIAETPMSKRTTENLVYSKLREDFKSGIVDLDTKVTSVYDTTDVYRNLGKKDFRDLFNRVKRDIRVEPKKKGKSFFLFLYFLIKLTKYNLFSLSTFLFCYLFIR